jgi:MATE family multidrug resistance protein
MRTELRAMLRIAGPVILGEIGWMTMGLVDSAMVGPLGPAALGATGLSANLFIAIAIFGMGLMLGLDMLVSRATGAGDRAEGIRWLGNGLWLALAASPVLLLAAAGIFLTIDHWGLHPDVLVLARPYLRTLLLGLPPLLVYAACRRYLQGIHVVGPIVWALVTANILNAFGNWVLIYGHLGMPALGVIGSAWATNIARVYVAAAMWFAVRRVHRRWGPDTPPVRIAITRARLMELLQLGGPAAAQVTLEVGVFSVASAMAGMLTPVALGSHQVTLNIVSTAFMVPLGLSSAAAVRVGHAAGARDPQRMVHAGWAAFVAVTVIMLTIAAVFALGAAPLVRLFTRDAAVVAVGVQLLWLVAPFQWFDGVQAIATGVLRGLGDTRTPVLANVVAHWILGLPLGYALCFWWGWGNSGLWLGLYTGLTVVGIFLMVVWMRRARALLAQAAAAAG